VVGDNQRQGREEEVGQVEREEVELQGGLLNGFIFECVISVCEICNSDLIFYVILDLCQRLRIR
jgi:hypothetical protein